MRRRSRAGGERAKSQRHKAVTPKRRSAPESVGARGSSVAGQETEVARLTRERNEAQEQQTATADVLKVISHSTFDLQAVLDTLVKSAARLCEADTVAITRPRDGAMHFAANFGLPREFEEIAKKTSFVPGRGTVVGRVLLAGKPVQIADVEADPEYTFTKGQKAAGFRTVLGVPLEREGETIGVIILNRTKVRPFTDKQIALVQNFAAQAVIAIENTRLLNELRQRTDDLTESLEQQTATADVLRIISSSPGDLAPVFQAMLENATRICEAKFGNLALLDGSALRIVALHNAPSALADARRREPVVDLKRSIAGLAISAKKPVHVADLAADERYVRSVLATAGGARTALVVPMLKEDEIIGTIAIYRQEVRPFTGKQIELVQNFAAQAVIAIENTRLLNELHDSLNRQTATADVLKVISGSLGELEPVFQAMLENAVRICGAKFGNVYRWDGDALRLAGTHNTPPVFVEQRRRSPLRPSPKAPLGRLIATKSVVHVIDATNEPAYVEQREPGIVAGIELAGMRTLVGVPMLKEGELIGVLSIYRQEVRPFTDKQIELLQNFADQAVIAIENARLLNELRQSLEQQTATADVLRVISSSPGELQPVFATMLANIVRVCEATLGAVYRVEEDAFRFVAMHNTLPEHAQAARYTPFHPGPRHYFARMIATKAVDHVPDMAAMQGYLDRRPEYVAAVEAGRVRTALFVPMLKENNLIGAFALARRDVRAFADNQVELVQNFAAQAVIAIENTRLLNELRQRTDDLSESLEQQTATSEVLKVISSSRGELEPVFSSALANAVRICGAKLGVLFLWEGET